MTQHDPVGMSEQYEVLAVRYGTRQASAAEVFLNYHAYHEPDRPLGMDYFFWVARSLWAEAAQALPADADHTEIARWLDPERFPAD